PLGRRRERSALVAQPSLVRFLRESDASSWRKRTDLSFLRIHGLLGPPRLFPWAGRSHLTEKSWSSCPPVRASKRFGPEVQDLLLEQLPDPVLYQIDRRR